MRGSFVERLLARVDGEAATIWISAIFWLERTVELPILRRAWLRLLQENERLQSVWQDPDWVFRARTEAELWEALEERPFETLSGLAEYTIRRRISLETDLPARLTVATFADGRQGVVLQLHHALGDGRAHMYLCQRFWELCAENPVETGRLSPPQLTDARLLGHLLRHPLGLLPLFSAKNRVLAARGHALRRRDAPPGAPMMGSLQIRMEEPWDPAAAAGLFFGGLLAGMIAHDRALPTDAPYRFRIPVDLRRELGLGRSIENACSAVPIEIPAQLLQAGPPELLARLVPEALSDALRRGVHLSTTLECLVVSRLASKVTLQKHVRPDLLASRRANTMVATYVGAADRYASACPVPISGIHTQTPTWGATGLRLGRTLMFNVTCFEGFWNREDLSGFLEAVADWMAAQPGLYPQRIL